MTSEVATSIAPIASRLTILVQGDARPQTSTLLRQLRCALPHTPLLWSAYAAERRAAASLVDYFVECEDPGALPPTLRRNNAPPNNINRLIATTAAGLAMVRTSHVLRLRSDLVVPDVNALLHAYEHYCLGSHGERIGIGPLFTRHPDGLHRYLFHLSDWFMLGPTEDLRRYFDVPSMPVTEARWFENAHVTGPRAPMAQRFRARWTQEQYLCIHYARRLGYPVPAYLDDYSPALRSAYLHLLGNRFVVMPTAVTPRVPGYAHCLGSWFQRLDCVWHEDWLRLTGKAGGASRPLTGLRTPIQQAALARRALVRVWQRMRK